MATGYSPEKCSDADRSTEGELRSGLSIWPDTTCLARELVLELNTLSQETLRDTVVVLPTQRLSIWVSAALAMRRSAFVPPTFLNLDRFVRTTYQHLSTATPQPLLEDLEAELLLAGLIKKSGFRHLRVGHEHEVHQFFAELCDWGLGDQAFSDLQRIAAENIYLSDESIDTLKERVVELQALYGLFADETRRLGAFTKAQIMAFETAALPRLLVSGKEPLGRAHYFVGFTSLKVQIVPVLQTLLERPSTQIWINTPPDLAGGQNPLQQILDDLGQAARERVHNRANHSMQCGVPVLDRSLEEADRRSQVESDDTSAYFTPSPMTIVKAPSVLAEVAHALRLAKDAVTVEGLPPSRVAILVSDDTCYGNPLRAFIPRLGVEANLAISTPLSGTPLGTWLGALLDLIGSDEKIPLLLAYLGHPYSLTSSPITRAKLYKEFAASTIAQGSKALMKSPKLGADTKVYVRESLAPFAPFFSNSPKQKKGFSFWMERFSAALTPVLAKAYAAAMGESSAPLPAEESDKAPPAPTNQDSQAAVLRSAKEALDAALESLEAVAPAMGGEFTKADFLALVTPKLLAHDCRDVGEPLRGIQILSIEEARYVPFEKLFILGAAEGQFPRALPKDHLLDNYLKMRIGLPGWQFLEAIEDTTYHLLKARVPSLTLMYPAMQGTSPVVRSRFIESALVLGEALAEKTASDAELYQLLAPETSSPVGSDHSTEELGQFRGDKTALLLTTSASALTALLRCPYRFLLERLNVRALEFKEADDPQQEGDWLHDVLEAFFTGKASGREVCEPLQTGPFGHLEKDFRAYALSRLARCTEQLAPADFAESPVKLHLELFAWPAFVDHLTKLYDLRHPITPEALSRAAKGERERAIGIGKPVTVQVGSHRVALRGSIDAIDDLGETHLITDYKRRGVPPRSEALNGLSPQLALYALAYQAEREDRPLAQAIVGYWSILNGKWVGITSGQGARDIARDLGLISSKDKTSLEEAVNQLFALWEWRLDTLLSPRGLFAPDPSACGHCPYPGVCRRDDPALGDRIAAGAQLKHRFGIRDPAAAEDDKEAEGGTSREDAP